MTAPAAVTAAAMTAAALQRPGHPARATRTGIPGTGSISEERTPP